MMHTTKRWEILFTSVWRIQMSLAKNWWCALVVDLLGAASVVFVNLSSLLRSSSTKERGDQEQDQGNRKDGQGLLGSQVIRGNTEQWPLTTIRPKKLKRVIIEYRWWERTTLTAYWPPSWSSSKKGSILEGVQVTRDTLFKRNPLSQKGSLF